MLPVPSRLPAHTLSALLVSLATQNAWAQHSTEQGAPEQPSAATKPAQGADEPAESGKDASEKAEPATSEADQKPASEGDASTKDESESKGSPGEEGPGTPPAAIVAPVKEATPPLRPEAQSPEPVPLDDAPDGPARALEVGALVGIANRPSEGDLITYGPAVAWGIYARPAIRPWIGVRLYFREESIPVTVDQGGFNTGTSDFGTTEFTQPNLKLRSLGALVEPTWEVAPRLRLMASVGIAWLRFVAPPATSEGQIPDIATAKRAGVELDFIGGLGASFELIPDWFNVGATIAYGVATQRTGSAHQDVQAFSGGQRYSLGGLPRFDGVTDLLFSFGLIL